MKTNRGFSIIEFIMVIVIAGIIFALAGSMLSVGFRSYFTTKPTLSNAVKLNTAMTNIMQEIRSANSITTTSATSITFVNSAGQTIIISLSGNNLMRSVNAGVSQIVCDNITSIDFSYYNTTFNTESTASSVRFVILKLVLTNNNSTYSLINGTMLRANL